MAELLDKIHSVAYWRVVIRPAEFDTRRIPSLGQCKEIVEASQVVLRGWDYPHLEEVRTGGDDWIESGCDWEGRHLEYWRFHTSAQFAHQFSAIEEFHRLTRTPAPERYMIVPNMLYTVTEIFEFAARLARHDILRPTAHVSIQLHGMRDRELTYQDLMRSMGFGPYVCSRDEITYETDASDAQLLGRAAELAIDATIALYERFEWFSPSRAPLVEEQRKFLERRLGF